MTDTLIEAPTPMLRRYSMCTGETLRSTQWLMSTGGAATAPQHGHRHCAHVGNQPQAVQHVQAPRLLGNVAGRIAHAEQRRQPVAARFGNHVATAIRSEAVAHHAVETGDAPDLIGRHLQQRPHGRLALEPVERAVRFQRKDADGLQRHVTQLELDDDSPAMGVRDAIELVSAQFYCQHQRYRVAGRQRDAFFDHLANRWRKPHRSQRQAIAHLQQQQRGRIGASGFEHGEGVKHEHGAVALHRARHMDRFVRTVRQAQHGCVEGRLRAHASAPAHGTRAVTGRCRFPRFLTETFVVCYRVSTSARHRSRQWWLQIVNCAGRRGERATATTGMRENQGAAAFSSRPVDLRTIPRAVILSR